MNNKIKAVERYYDIIASISQGSYSQNRFETLVKAARKNTKEHIRAQHTKPLVKPVILTKLLIVTGFMQDIVDCFHVHAHSYFNTPEYRFMIKDISDKVKHELKELITINECHYFIQNVTVSSFTRIWTNGEWKQIRTNNTI